MNELATISKLRQAQLTIHEVRELDEIKRLIDQSEALKGYARAQQLSKEMQQDIAEYNLYATRQMGVISAAMEKATANQYSKVLSPLFGESKTRMLANAGVDFRRANEAERLAAIPENDFAGIIEQQRKNDINWIIVYINRIAVCSNSDFYRNNNETKTEHCQPLRTWADYQIRDTKMKHCAKHRQKVCLIHSGKRTDIEPRSNATQKLT